MATGLSNWQIGAVGFSVALPDYIKNTFFENADNLKVRRNNAVEFFANYLNFRKSKIFIFVTEILKTQNNV